MDVTRILSYVLPDCRERQRAIPCRRRGPDFASGSGKPPDIAAASQWSHAQRAAIWPVAANHQAGTAFSAIAVRPRPLGDFAGGPGGKATWRVSGRSPDLGCRLTPPRPNTRV